jgi:plasmid stability protein
MPPLEVTAMSMPAKRSTIYLAPDLHRALRIKAIHTHRSMSDLVNDAVRMALREDQEDLAAFEERAGEPTMTYEELLQDLRAHGKI